ncbi:MAG: hypothetical protein BMS9Abin34_406 [Patescibacteria group bacterium]|nr:MAG: hypothetical protein BMS9Abin34_406 [Patescibacteria group bacterium]
MSRDELHGYSSKEAERAKRREKKRQPKMRISGRSVLELARIISARSSAPGGAGKKRRSKRRKG